MCGGTSPALFLHEGVVIGHGEDGGKTVLVSWH